MAARCTLVERVIGGMRRPGPATIVTVNQYERYAQDGEVLAAIGKVLRERPEGVSASLPQGLALEAVAAWARDEVQELASESDWQASVRGQAAVLALIGLGIEEGSDVSIDPVMVHLDPDLIADAIAAAVASAG